MTSFSALQINPLETRQIWNGSINNLFEANRKFGLWQSYILYWGEPSYVEVSLIYLGMSLLFTDFQQCM